MKVKSCRICKSKQLKKILSLGNQPLANSLIKTPHEKIDSYLLEWLQCSHCNLIQLSYVVPKEKMFDNYFYIPSISKDHLKDFENMAQMLIDTLNLKRGSLIVDVGGSDGSLLKCFKDMKKLNIEPALNIDTGGIDTYKMYFNQKTAKKAVNEYGKAKLIIMTNVLAHIDNLDEIIQALDILLDEDGIFFARFPNVKNLITANQFDTIYHEHLSYFTYEPLYHLFLNTPFEILRIEETPIHGGSMMLYVKRRNNDLGQFLRNIKKIKNDLHQFIVGEKKKGKRIVGFGAAAKGTMLLNLCRLDANLIEYVADGTPYKIGKFIPGVKIPVLDEKKLEIDRPDIILILAWNWKEEIMRKLAGRGFIFVVPIPKIEILK